MKVIQMLGDAAHPTVVLLKSEAVTGDAALERNAKAEGAAVRRLAVQRVSQLEHRLSGIADQSPQLK